MAVATWNSLVVCEERRVENHFDRDQRDRCDDDLIGADRYTSHIKDEVVDQIDLIGRCDDIEVHRETLNLIKTRYKYMSNSVGSLSATVMALYGKRDVKTLNINMIGKILVLFRSTPLSLSWLKSRILVQGEVVSC